MLKAVGSRLTYANVMATVAVFLALGGGAYALTGIPDRSGVYHGCVDPKAGALRVVKSASSCRKTRTVQHGTRRVRILGESAITWNQQGPRGLQGIQGAQGLQGLQGTRGLQGPPGPTFGTSSIGISGLVTNPSASPDEPATGGISAQAVGREETFSLPASGNVYLRFFTPGIREGCNPSTQARAGLYLDGAPVASTSEPLDATTTAPGEWVAVVHAAAGQHTADVRKDCPNGALNGGFDNDAGSTWTVVLLSG